MQPQRRRVARRSARTQAAIHRDHPTRLDLELRALLAVAQLARHTQAGAHHRALEDTPLPGEVDLEAAAGAQARDTARPATPRAAPAAGRSRRRGSAAASRRCRRVPPKLPSIWNGGWVSNRFGRCDLREQRVRVLARRARRRRSRAQKLMIQARLQPVWPPPCASRRSSDDARRPAPAPACPRSVIWCARVQAEQVRDVPVARLRLRRSPRATPAAGRACRSGTAAAARARAASCAAEAPRPRRGSRGAPRCSRRTGRG